MRVLFSTYPTAFQNPGGGEQIIDALYSRLKARGCEVLFFDPFTMPPSKIPEFDIIHYFSCVQSEFWTYVKNVAPQVPLIVTPTLYAPRDWKTRFRFLLRNLRWDLLGKRSVFSHPDLFLPCTDFEKQTLTQFYRVSPQRCEVVPNGIEDFFLNDSSPEGPSSLFRKHLHEKTRGRFGQGPFVLHVGRFHPVKNHFQLIAAAEKARVAVVFIGSADSENLAYFEECKRRARLAETNDSSGETRFFFQSQLEHSDPLLASAYSSCDLFVLMSRFETFGISAYEAGLAGAPIALTKAMVTLADFQGWVDLFDSESHDELRQILQKFKDARWPKPDPGEVKRRKASILNKYSWDLVSNRILEIYRSKASRD
ncbi:MAG: glycosyltransferase family 4 protein [Bdellovibrio sp.]|nr:glycosyltransferase family 4 protein [Bdellovibrio sp.]